MSSPEIILYDISLNAERGLIRGGTPNTWKTRLALNYKGIPYKTVWVEYADIQKVGQVIGATATEKRSNGELRYTLPTIVVPATGEVISDSGKIAAYLEAKYPEKALFTEGKLGEQLAFEGQLFPILGPDVPLFCTYRAHQMMTPASGAALDRLLRDVFGLPIKDLPPPNADTFKRAEQNLSKLAATYNGQKYLAGDHITYPDLVVAAVLVCLVNSLNDEERGQFNTWDNGKWAAILGEFGAAGYLAMDDGEIHKADLK